MLLFTKPAWLLRLSIGLLFLASWMLLFYSQPGLGGLGPCEMLGKKLASSRVRDYLGRDTDLNLLEPITLALLHKKLETLLEKRTPIDCAVVLYHGWRN